jgi:hydrogenase 3 maturation protease
MSKDTVIMCVGNRDVGDDGIGPYIAERLQKDHSDFVVLDAGISPENYTSVVKRHQPKTLILVDAADMGLPAGEIRIVPEKKIGTMHLSTHGVSLALLIEFLKKDIKEIMVIGIQPKTMSGPLSARVRKSGEHLIDVLQKKSFRDIPVL